jgi:HD superfamily phosphohydrolase
LILGKMEPSRRWQRHVEGFSGFIKSAAKAGRFSGRVRKDALSDGLLDVLHSLISGTLDVDRMDYLRRDSYYMGVPYGVCDVDMSSLRLGSI